MDLESIDLLMVEYILDSGLTENKITKEFIFYQMVRLKEQCLKGKQELVKKKLKEMKKKNSMLNTCML